MSDVHVRTIISKYKHGSTHTQQVNSVKTKLDAKISPWAGSALNTTLISGSMAKGTAITLGSDFDLLISFTSTTTNTLNELYDMLDSFLQRLGFVVTRQNVSLRIVCDGLKVDIVPAKKHSGHTNDHSIYVSKLQTWKLTNIQTHINIIKCSGRIEEILLTKIWSKLHNLDFPSIYLELTVLNALHGRPTNQPDLNFQHVLYYLSTSFVNARVCDPANTNNIISDTLSTTEKEFIENVAKIGYASENWNGVIW